jgi:hypothetical protein
MFRVSVRVPATCNLDVTVPGRWMKRIATRGSSGAMKQTLPLFGNRLRTSLKLDRHGTPPEKLEVQVLAKLLCSTHPR